MDGSPDGTRPAGIPFLRFLPCSKPAACVKRFLLTMWLGAIAGSTVSAASPVEISELMARNSSTLADEDGDYSDWIELHNTSGATVNLAGWYLTDSATAPTRWRLPSTNLPANGYLVVFASGKDRSIAGAPLHTNFQLGGDGEYLALVEPDGTTRATEFAPAFPQQVDDVSYGESRTVTVTNLIAGGAAARYLIPGDGALGTNWTGLLYNDAGWTSGVTGIGYATGVGTGNGELFAYWPIREGAGNVASNLIAGGTHGTLHGAAWSTDPARGTVLNFNGADSYASAGTIPPMGQSTSNFTWSFWYRQSSVPNVNAVVLGNRAGGTQSPLQFIKFTPGNFEYYRGGNIGFIPYSIPTGSWRHLVVVKNGPALAYYDNALQVGAASAGADVEGNPFYWGGDPGAPGEYADGMLDDISLWSTALTASQIALLHGGASPLDLSGLGGQITTDVRDDMFSVNATAYLRVPFTVSDGATYSGLKLRIQYDDGFVAFLNGVEVARRNAPASAQWNSGATGERPASEATRFEEVDVSSHLDVLENGANVLAIHGLNLSANDPDFLVLPELEATTIAGEGARYFGSPTPGAANDPGFLGFVADTKFSHERGFHENPFAVTITCGTSGATIRYTTDGTAPSETSGTVYTGPIPIAGTTVLRAGAFKPGYQTADTDAQTYLFLDDIFAQNGAGLPNNWGNDWRMDPRVVTNAAYAGRIRDDMKSLPVVSIALDAQQFWGASGIYTMATSQGVNFERACSAELFFPDRSRNGFQINCGIRIAGGASRSGLTPKHGLRLLFKSQYGASKLNYPFFEDTEVDQFDSIAFRPNFNMSWVRTDNSGPLNNSNADGAERTHAIYVRDQFTKDSYTAMGQVGAHERFVHLYINGVYWGLYNPCERTDASFAATYFGGETEDYDAIFSDLSSVARPVDGDKNAWNSMLDLANQGLTGAAAYAEIQKTVDVTNLADYMMLNFYCSTVDWPWQNWNALRKRETNGLFRFIVWDAEYTLETPPWVPADRTGVGAASNEADSPARLYHQIRQNAEWRLLFADRAHRHFFNNGALTTNQTIPRFVRHCDEIDRAIVGESARWGDVVRTSQPYTRDGEWVAEKNRLLTQFFPQRTALVIQQFRAAGLYPSLEAPSYSRHGGVFTNPLALAMTAPQGAIYFTTNGTDPRLPGGAIAPGATAYGGPLTLTASRRVLARAFHTNGWSALNEAVFIEATPVPLRITEIMYHPRLVGPNSADDFEFIEVKNVGASPLNLAGAQFTAGITFTFSNRVLDPGQLAVVVKNRPVFESRYGAGVPVAGEYLGTLSDGGERLRLEGPLGEVIHDFDYLDWHPVTDGLGFSLVPVNTGAPLDRWREKSGWRASRDLNGSPGADDAAPSLPGILINELLTHTDLPQVDAIELHNPTATDVNLGGWSLTDDPRAPWKFRIEDPTVLPAGGYLVFTEADFNPLPGTGTGFSFGSTGDEAWLFSGDAATNLTGYTHGFGYGAAQNGETFGRYLNSVGEEQFPAQRLNTLGFANSGPRVGPVVITEIMYHPAPGGDEFVELKNIASTNVPLYSSAIPTDTWSIAGLGFDFPPAVTLTPNQVLLVVAGDPAVFRTRYSVPGGVMILGPANGLLQDDGETVEIRRPDTPDPEGTPQITVEGIRYSHLAPWPLGTDGTGASLQRRIAAVYGNDPANWFAATATPGVDNTTNLPPELGVSRSGPDITLSWDPGSSAYTLESTDQIPSANWTSVPGVVNNSITVPPSAGNKFYRLRGP